MSGRKRLFIAIPAILLLIVVGCIFAANSLRRSLYPAAPPMPPIVNQSMEELLAKLQSRLHEKAPAIEAALRPGLSPEKIAALEKKGGLELSSDLKALYMWHDGTPLSAGPMKIQYFTPIHRFTPFDEAIHKRQALKDDVAKLSFVQRTAFGLFAGHRTNWIGIFEDLSGDGYFCDPDRKPEEGAIFYVFAEDGSYIFFPSVKNLIAGIDECYEKGAYRLDAMGELDADFELSHKIMLKYGATPSRDRR